MTFLKNLKSGIVSRDVFLTLEITKELKSKIISSVSELFVVHIYKNRINFK